MSDIYFQILPDSYLSHSVITTVWIGIMVIAFFNLRFGWIFTGLVVPGYLTPLLLIKPLSVGIIFIESIITYLIIYLLSEVAAKKGLWTNFFGRDRFFALLLASVGVRLFFDGWALPLLNQYSVSQFGVNLDVNDSLHSFGLIIVALIANHLWKPKLVHGLFQLAITIGITYFIIRYVFIPYTNFSLSNIEYLYEDVAGSILASPKSYIILIVTAYIASRMNLLYGWEFNGILVPSLLALQWYQPSKIVVFFVEAYVMLFLATLVLKLPLFKNMNMEGARKLVFFFNVGFFYKIAISLVIVEYFPTYKVSDYFGFGYLLSTLIAIKIYDKISMPLFTRSTLQTSLVSIFIATVIGYGLTLIPSGSIFTQIDSNTTQEYTSYESNNTLLSFLEEKKVKLYQKREDDISINPKPSELGIFENVLSLIDKSFEKNRLLIEKLLWKINYDYTLVQNRYIVLSQKENHYGWGIYIIDLEAKHNLLLEVPFPLNTSNIMQSAIVLMSLTEAKILSISGVSHQIQGRLRSEGVNSYYSLYHTFHKHYAKNNVIQVRSLTNDTHKELKLKRYEGEKRSTLFIKGYQPKEFKLSTLKEYLNHLEIEWEDKTKDSIQKKSMHNGFTELYLTRRDRQRLISSHLYFQYALEEDTAIHSIKGLLQAWVLDKKLEISKKESQRYIKPKKSEILFFDKVVFTPLYHLLKFWETENPSVQEMKAQLYSIALSVKSFGYTLAWYKDTSLKKDYIILYKSDPNSLNYWGTYIFKVQNVQNIMIQTPRPFYEPYTFEYSLDLFTQLNAKALLLSNAHPLTNSDLSADVMLLKNKGNIFNLVNQVFFRESKESSMNALQIRGMQASKEEQASSAILAFHNIFHSISQLNSEERLIYNYLKDHISLRINDGNKYSAGYDSISTQSLYLSQSKNNTFNTLWLPPFIRTQYKQGVFNQFNIQPFKSLHIPIEEVSLFSTLSSMKISKSISCHEDLFNQIKHYLDTKDIVELESIKDRSELSIKLLIDSNNKQPYILLKEKASNVFIGVIKLNATQPYLTQTIDRNTTLMQTSKLFYHNTSSILKMEDSCVK